MRKTGDYTHRFRADNGVVGMFRVRMYEGPAEVPLIVCSGLPDNIVSPTNYCEMLAAEVVLTVLPEAALAARKRERFFRWVEHYPEFYRLGKKRETFDMVGFSDYRIRTGERRRRLRDPRKALEEDARSRYGRPVMGGGARWTRIDRKTVEELAGMTLDDAA